MLMRSRSFGTHYLPVVLIAMVCKVDIMCLKTSNEFNYIENWLVMLIHTYKKNPSRGLAKTINYYLNKLLEHDDIFFCGEKRCEYLVMQRFWHFHAVKK